VSAQAEPWNLGGGVDSDGCRYAVDQSGRRRVPVDRSIVTCSTCNAGFPKELSTLTLTAAERVRVRAIATNVGRSPGRRWGVAAATLRLLGLTRLGREGNLETRVGEMFLRGAWEARARAVKGKLTGGYAPMNLKEADEQVAILDRRVRQDPRRRPDVVNLECLLTELEAARASLDEGLLAGLDAIHSAVSGIDPSRREEAQQSLLQSRRSLLQSRSRFARLERQLLVQKLALLDEEGGREDLSVPQLRRALTTALIRSGSPARWRVHLDKLGPEADVMRAACAEEAGLLESAKASFLQAAEDPQTGDAERARLLYLAGDAARRRGEDAEAQRLFADVIGLAPESEVGRRAALLRGR
jgi:hypothetical protein